MIEPCIILTNNPLSKKTFEDRYEVEYKETEVLDIMCMVRNRIHEGHRLLTHPLMSSVKPNETPYRTILISKEKGKLDFDSLAIIEDSINTTQKFLNMAKTPKWTQSILEDFELIDMDLIKNALNL
ncbi:MULTISPECIES: GrdX family protein [Clostridium]|uniref:GrdX protein n=1 Tax=Clostridium cadaveris TaxID=1529 RepID=A0A316MFZ8_9CLOT|nr:GrdX family protein [Clostridium cadaveris]MDU4952088.1 GrdX family protein [Clostridium sp.]MDY4949683.1 GrdX family protein [Clostridium cadaveris]NWK11396.1 GrdX family protein [Clostridium cadaveris]PWL51340.1 MAG: GrdX protein [Clostridium cadaveris]